MKRRTSPPVPDAADLTMDRLVDAIAQTHRYFSIQAGKAVNISLTLRNWMMGCFIQEYEQYGADRAQYGEQLLAVWPVPWRKMAWRMLPKGICVVSGSSIEPIQKFGSR